MPKLIHRVTTTVTQVRDSYDGVRVLELSDPDGWELPPFTAGAHIDVHLPSGTVRQYSLCGDPARQNRYLIAVKHEKDGRGGSSEIHRDIAVGCILPASLPRNQFPLAEAPHHVLIGGGIGITPFLSMIQVLERFGGSFELHYGTRTPAETPFLDALAPRAEAGRVRHYFSRVQPAARMNLEEILGGVSPDAHVYCCGPASLMNAVREIGGERFEGRLHLEAFGADNPGSESDFQVEIASTGQIIDVPKGQTILNALRTAGLEINSSCEGGVCLECKTRYLEGTPIHKDLTLPAEDRREFLTPCVSGCSGSKLVLDL